MKHHILTLPLNDDQFRDLTNALEDYRDYFLRQAQEASLGFGLDAQYWSGRAEEIEKIRTMVLEVRE